MGETTLPAAYTASPKVLGNSFLLLGTIHAHMATPRLKFIYSKRMAALGTHRPAADCTIPKALENACFTHPLTTLDTWAQ